MKTNMTIDEIRNHIRYNVFNKQFYSVSLTINRAIAGMFMYTGVDGKDLPTMDMGDSTPIEKIFDAVPDFQRNNNKWSEEMQIGFIENVLCGYKTEIMLFEIGDTCLSRCQIIDGLQRITAFYRFLSGEIKAFGKSYEELKEVGLCGRMKGLLTLRVYSFDSKNDAIDFYIGMNKNITHSPSDIDKALSFKTN